MGAFYGPSKLLMNSYYLWTNYMRNSFRSCMFEWVLNFINSFDSFGYFVVFI